MSVVYKKLMKFEISIFKYLKTKKQRLWFKIT